MQHHGDGLMGVKVRKNGAKWYVVVDNHGRRKAKCVGSREAAEQVRRQVEAKLALGDLSILDTTDDKKPTFDVYADGWLKDYVRIECKTSTAKGYEGVLEQYLRPRFGKKALNQIRRDDIKALINHLISEDLSRNTIRNALCVIHSLFNYAIEEGFVEFNPAARLGRFTRSAKTPETKGIALTTMEVQQFLKAAREIFPDCAAENSWRSSGAKSSLAAMTMTLRASFWCSTTTCTASTRRRKASNQDGWIYPASFDGCSSNFETSVCWRLT